MRNEIFNHIKQNRNRYFSELKKNYNKISSEEKNTDIKSSQKDFQPLEKNQTKTIKIRIPKIKSKIKPVHRSLNRLSNHSGNFMRKGINVFENLNNRLIAQTDKITQRFYEVSSKFFEDSSDLSQEPEKYNFTDTNIKYERTTGSLNLAGFGGSALLTLDESYLTSQDKIILWMNKLYNKFILFLESDDWTVKDRKLITPKEVKEIRLDQNESIHMKILPRLFDHLKDPQKRKEGFASINKIVQIFLKNPIVSSVSIIGNAELVLHFGKKIPSTLFPIINRFI